MVFKDPFSAFRSNGGLSQETFRQVFGENGTPDLFENIPSASTEGLPFPAIAPRPSVYGSHNDFAPACDPVVSFLPGGAYANMSYIHQHKQPSSLDPMSRTLHRYSEPESPTVGFQAGHNGWNTAPSYPALQHHTTGGSDSGIDMSPQDGHNVWPQTSGAFTSSPAQFTPAYTMAPLESPTEKALEILQAHQDVRDSQRHMPSHGVIQFPTSTPETAANNLRPSEGKFSDVINNGIIQHQTIPGLYYRSQIPKAEPEDDWFDVDSDEEMADIRPRSDEYSSTKMGLMIAMSAQQNERELRNMTNFLNEPNVLSTYDPSYAASPLRDPQTARIFSHFIIATGPMINVCERHPSNPAVIFTGKAVPQSQRSLWSYTIPMLGLHNQALLHAMLALASLHISKLQQASPHPSLRHYHYALRKVAKALGNLKKRRNVATLAATLLLGFYEVTTAEHNKWNSHLSGARELIMEVPFAETVRRIEAHRNKQREKKVATSQAHDAYDHWHGNALESNLNHPDQSPSKLDWQIDENLVGTIMGWKTRYGEYGQIVSDSEPVSATDTPLTQKDVENFEIQSDLFWWYAKQDVYQSILSGNRLLLSYDRWGHCPPRAPIGRQDAVYGSMDHLMLLMARLADFGGKDLPRKKRAASEAAKRTTQAQSRTPPTPSHQQAPPFYGMMPDPGPVRLPRGFNQAEHDRLYSVPAPSDDKSFEVALQEAEAEWNAIRNAFEVYLESLGPAFNPLSPEHMQPLSTPFGPAIYYRSYSIASVMVLYYCGLIILTRTHPCMPPASMVAAGVAAPQTAKYANNIGRICAGIQPVSNTAPLNPHHGAALMEVCMGLFHAGVQFQDPAQRGWTITKLRDVARLCGFETSSLIASGCETAWAKAGQMGKGPPYQRTLLASAEDDRLKGRSSDPRLMDHPPRDNNDRRFVHRNAGTRVYWAMGILSVEEDMKEMTLN